MIITWYGENSFKIQSGNTTIITDPFPSSIGLTPPRGEATATVKTLVPADAVEFSHTVAGGAGEYEFDGVSIAGFPIENKNALQTVYVIEMEGITIGVLGALTDGLPPKVLEELEEVDILIIPGGGAPLVSVSEATRLIKQIEPKIVIPSLYKVQGLKRQTGDVAAFLKEMGQKSATPQEKLVLKKKDLETMIGTTVQVLNI